MNSAEFLRIKQADLSGGAGFTAPLIERSVLYGYRALCKKVN